jgi:gliding motility-associated-like protein
LLGGAGNSQHGNTLFDATINFTDGTKQIFSNLYFTDWFGMLDVVALQGVSRVNFDTNVIENSSTDPSLYQKQLLIAPANYGKLIQSINIVKPGTLATLNVLAVSIGYGCTSAPAAGKAVADVATICGPMPVNLSLTGSATAPELTYQWQVSTNNGTTWTNIPGATSLTYTTTPTQTTQYRARLLCSSQTGTSTPVTITLVIPKATIAYQDSAYCQLGSSDLPKVSPAGGTFSGSAGLSLNTANGQIDLETSTPGKHRVTYTSTGLCPVTATDSVWIEAAPKPLFPNVITPNGDNMNDKFLVKMPPLTEYKMRIFNRWGSLVWENSDQNEGWSGSDAGVFFYHVQLKDCAGNQQIFKGWLEVIR